MSPADLIGDGGVGKAGYHYVSWDLINERGLAHFMGPRANTLLPS